MQPFKLEVVLPALRVIFERDLKRASGKRPTPIRNFYWVRGLHYTLTAWHTFPDAKHGSFINTQFCLPAGSFIRFFCFGVDKIDALSIGTIIHTSQSTYQSKNIHCSTPIRSQWRKPWTRIQCSIITRKRTWWYRYIDAWEGAESISWVELRKLERSVVTAKLSILLTFIAEKPFTCSAYQSETAVACCVKKNNVSSWAS